MYINIPVLLNKGNKIRIQTPYLSGTFYLERGVYPATGQPYLVVLDQRRSIIMKATSAIVGYTLDHDCCFIKNYSENIGIEEALIRAGVIKLTGESYNGFNVAKIIME